MVFKMILFLAFSQSTALPSPDSVFVATTDGGCVLLADKGEVWLNVYQETGNSEKGTPIGTYHLQKGETQSIDTQPNDRIRYDYKNDPNDDYHGNVGATCRDGQTVTVP